ncbi:cupin [Shinella sp. AETb1-6]|uniref:cupin domain-containing protein n=1 Tax=Shinella sp. AETb1-6 TaxID=2692210 RepID=UPI001370FED6|nr:cupin domain-containing protein [Shinella sp. AETb1-6]MXN50593.1 cupin [Shinella sp. AETb1-6]
MTVEEILFDPSEWVPNNPRLPVLLYGSVESEKPFEALFAANGWIGIWTNGVFDYQHYHTRAHEVLGVSKGNATLLIGGPGGRHLHVSKGDCLVLPAGTGHQNLGCSDDFEVVGAYPPNQHADIQTSAASAEQLSTIASVPLPRTDPVYGSSGPLLARWR